MTGWNCDGRRVGGDGDCEGRGDEDWVCGDEGEEEEEEREEREEELGDGHCVGYVGDVFA